MNDMETGRFNLEMSALLDADAWSNASLDEEKRSLEAHAIESVQLQTSQSVAGYDESLVTYHEPVESYEGRHRWDPHFQWDALEERKVVRKV